LGLDLSDDAQKKEQSQPQPAQAQPSPPPLEPEPAPAKKAEPILDEREITQEDRVKAVQRKLYLKTHRFELAGTLGGTVNDPFYQKAAESGKLSYFPADNLGIGVRAMALQLSPLDDAARAKADFHSRIFYSSPQWGAMAEVEWSALYGKAAIFNTILHFDLYLMAGLGVVETDTSHEPGNGPNPAGDLGFGLRFAVLDWMTVNASFFNLSYVDQPVGSTKSVVQNLQMPMIGVSIFIPFKSTGRESE
jgi:outer membrane beta-barrel protein